MSIPYRTRRVLNLFGLILLILMIFAILAWLCWAVWLQRYVVYEKGGAKLNFDRSANEVVGQVARPQDEEGVQISIYYNEGADAINTTQEMTILNGYYITRDMYKDPAGMDDVMLQVERLPSGTPVMIELKGGFGSFYYSSQLGEAVISQSTDIAAVDALVAKLQSKGFYTIAQISSLCDRSFGENHVPSGLYMLSRAGLWMDGDGFYWLDPTNASTISWISSVVMELRDMGFNEVLLSDFRFPASDQYIFNGDKVAALQECAAKLVTACAANNFTLSFGVTDPAFTLPEGRTRIYLEDVSATQLAAKASQTTFEEKDIRLVFLAMTGDTRYDDYSVLRSLNVAAEVEARKAK